MVKKIQLIAISAFIGLSPLFVSAPVYAQAFSGNNSTSSNKCGNTQTEFIACDSKTGLGTINDLIKISLIVLSFVIGIVATGTLAYAAMIYASARDDQSKVSEAKTLIRNVVIGLILYGFTIAIINWLLPGSVISAPAQQQGQTSGTQQTP